MITVDHAYRSGHAFIGTSDIAAVGTSVVSADKLTITGDLQATLHQ